MINKNSFLLPLKKNLSHNNIHSSVYLNVKFLCYKGKDSSAHPIINQDLIFNDDNGKT